MATGSNPKERNVRHRGAFSMTPEFLGQLIAAHTCGLVNANPEPDDIELATKFIEEIDKRYD